MAAKRGAMLAVEVQYASRDEAVPAREHLRAWARAACKSAGEVTVRFVDADEGRSLNRDYRQRDYATNVLSFPYTQTPHLTGDLVLCVPVVKREAQEQGKAIDAHFAHLVVHGILHLQGFDHETDLDAEKMEHQERLILAALGYPDPYAEEYRPPEK